MSLIAQAVVWLGAAVIAVPIAARLGLGSVLGYLIAGVAIGPFGLQLVAQESESVMHFAELGVVMMLFLVGLELSPERLWRLRGPVFGLGGMQMTLTAALVAPLALALGLPWQQALALGLITAMSSTAIALQSLTERGWMGSPGGQTSFAILLFQDVAVIPLLALFPLLATLPIAGGADAHSASLIAGLPGWQQGVAIAAAIGAVILAGRLAVGPLMRAVASTKIRELFTAAALLIVLSVASLMSAVGLSAALGTFVAGVVLANSEYRHELVSDIEPFKGLLLGLFFMAVGASIDLALMAASPLKIAALLLAALAIKAAVLLLIARAGRLGAEQGALLMVAMAQVGEFAFVLFSFAGQNGVLPPEVTAPMIAVTALSMATTPFMMMAHARLISPWLLARSARGAPVREADTVEEHHQVIIAGYGRFGQIAGRLLRAHGIGVTVLDIDANQIAMLARFGQEAFYGDAARHDLLHAAGAAQARLLIIAVDDPAQALTIVEVARAHFPHLALLARARGRTEAFELIEHGVEQVYRETFDTALQVGVDALRLLGHPAHEALRAGRMFKKFDERTLRELAGQRDDQAAFITRARERLDNLARVLAADQRERPPHEDHGWERPAPPQAAPSPKQACGSPGLEAVEETCRDRINA